MLAWNGDCVYCYAAWSVSCRPKPLPREAQHRFAVSELGLGWNYCHDEQQQGKIAWLRGQQRKRTKGKPMNANKTLCYGAVYQYQVSLLQPTSRHKNAKKKNTQPFVAADELSRPLPRIKSTNDRQHEPLTL